MGVSIRTKFFWWLVVVLLTFFLVQTAAWFLYEYADWRETKTEPVSHVLKEMAVLLAVDAAVLPILLLLIWLIPRGMVRPLRAMADTAGRIGDGHLTERISEMGSESDEIDRLARTMNQAFDRYEEANARLRRFASDASHQLRTPLTGLQSAGEVALLQQRSSAAYEEAIGHMLEEAQRLSMIVEKLLMLARLDASGIREQFTELDLAGVLRPVASQYETIGPERGLTFASSLAAACRVHGDADLLQQAVFNLLDNALKYTPSGGTIRLAVEAQGAAGAAIAVEDTGCGIPEEQCDAIFDRFHRSAELDVPGDGLGLAIVADIARVHGGTVEVESRVGKGSVFILRLPCLGPASA